MRQPHPTKRTTPPKARATDNVIDLNQFRVDGPIENGPPTGVVMGFISGGMVEHFCMESLVQTLMFDAAHDRVLVGGKGGLISQVSSPRIAQARTELVQSFLTSEALAEAEWLWMFDTDMTWEWDALYRLLAIAHPVERPVVGGLCFAGSPDRRCFPTLYALDRDEHGPYTHIIEDYPDDSLIQVGATGAAFLLVHRTVLLRMGQPHPDGFGSTPDGRHNPYPWFYEGGTHNGRPYGEDIAFCIRLAAMGIPLFVHTGVKVGHVKPSIMGEQHYRVQQARALED